MPSGGYGAELPDGMEYNWYLKLFLTDDLKFFCDNL